MSAERILVCDDEPSLRELMRLALGADFAFAEASSAAEAVERARELRPDLVLLDVMMPGGSGLEALAEIRADPELSETRVVIVSAFTSDSDRRSALAAGATAFVPKPFDPDDLAAVVEDALGRGD